MVPFIIKGRTPYGGGRTPYGGGGRRDSSSSSSSDGSDSGSVMSRGSIPPRRGSFASMAGQGPRAGQRPQGQQHQGQQQSGVPPVMIHARELNIGYESRPGLAGPAQQPPAPQQPQSRAQTPAARNGNPGRPNRTRSAVPADGQALEFANLAQQLLQQGGRGTLIYAPNSNMTPGQPAGDSSASQQQQQQRRAAQPAPSPRSAASAVGHGNSRTNAPFQASVEPAAASTPSRLGTPLPAAKNVPVLQSRSQTPHISREPSLDRQQASLAHPQPQRPSSQLLRSDNATAEQLLRSSGAPHASGPPSRYVTSASGSRTTPQLVTVSGPSVNSRVGQQAGSRRGSASSDVSNRSGSKSEFVNMSKQKASVLILV